MTQWHGRVTSENPGGTFEEADGARPFSSVADPSGPKSSVTTILSQVECWWSTERRRRTFKMSAVNTPI